MKKTVLFLLIISVVLSCKTNKTTKQTDFNQIAWLSSLKNNFKEDTSRKHQIIHYKYNEKDVFLVDDCYQCADGLIRIYDIDKTIICEFGGIIGKNTCPDFEQEAKKMNFIFNDVN